MTDLKQTKFWNSFTQRDNFFFFLNWQRPVTLQRYHESIIFQSCHKWWAWLRCINSDLLISMTQTSLLCIDLRSSCSSRLDWSRFGRMSFLLQDSFISNAFCSSPCQGLRGRGSVPDDLWLILDSNKELKVQIYLYFIHPTWLSK